MANVAKKVMPRIADIRCSKIQFQPGDRVLVRLYNKLDIEQIKKLRRSINKWAGCEVEVLFYNSLAMEIEVERPVSQIQGSSS